MCINGKFKGFCASVTVHKKARPLLNKTLYARDEENRIRIYETLFTFHIFHSRFEARGNNMSHAEASAYCRAAGDLQLRGHAVYGV